VTCHPDLAALHAELDAALELARGGPPRVARR
jgi:hypothetical protein